MNDILAKQKLEDEIITVSLLCAHFEACDNILLNSNSLFTFKAKSHVNLIRKKVKHLIKDIEKRLSEEQVEELDMLCDYYEQVLNQADKMLATQIHELQNANKPKD
jgi:hypothetical protein